MKSVREMSSQVFSKFDLFANNKGFPGSTGIRYIQYNRDDADFPSKARISDPELVIFNYSEKIVLASYGNSYLIYDIGSNIDASNTNFAEEDAKCGHVIFLFYHCPPNIPHDKSLSTIRDNITELDNSIPEYSGHDYNSFLENISPLKLYSLDRSNHILEREVLKGLFGSWSNRNYDISEETRQQIKKLIDRPFAYKRFFTEISTALTSDRPSQFFNQMYRCLESIMFVDYFQRAKSLHFKGTYSDFIAFLDDVAAVRPREIDALTSLVDRSKSDSSNFQAIGNRIPGVSAETHPAKIIYKLRNLIVHGRPLAKKEIIDADDWDKAIGYIAGCIYEIIESIS